MNLSCPAEEHDRGELFVMEDAMYDNIEICRKLTEVMPELGVCGFDINVTHDEELKAWRIDYDAADKRAVAFLDEEDVDRCLIGKKCLALELAAHEQLIVGS